VAEVEDDPRAWQRNQQAADLRQLRRQWSWKMSRPSPRRGEAKVFDMVDAIGQRRGPQAQRELPRLLESAEPLYALSMIVRSTLIVLAREMLNERATGDISQVAWPAPFPTGKIRPGPQLQAGRPGSILPALASIR